MDVKDNLYKSSCNFPHLIQFEIKLLSFFENFYTLIQNRWTKFK